MNITKFSILFFFCALSSSAHAQYAPYPVIAGLVVHCTDANGVKVFTAFDLNNGDVGVSSMMNGTPVIRLIPNLTTLPPLIQEFVYAHECGHHISGDIARLFLVGHDNLAREQAADRIGIRLLRDQLALQPLQAALIADAFRNNPPMPPYYLDGPLRARWITACYQSDDDSCSSNTVYQRKGITPGWEGLCRSMDRLIDVAERKMLGSSRGKRLSRDEDTTTWGGPVDIPGAVQCLISKLDGDSSFDVSCKFGREQYSAMRERLNHCLRDWEAKDGTWLRGRQKITWSKDGKPDISLRQGDNFVFLGISDLDD